MRGTETWRSPTSTGFLTSRTESTGSPPVRSPCDASRGPGLSSSAGARYSLRRTGRRPNVCFTRAGVLIVMWDRRLKKRVASQFEQRKVAKEYLALVHGIPEPASGTVEAPIAPVPDSDYPR